MRKGFPLTRSRLAALVPFLLAAVSSTSGAEKRGRPVRYSAVIEEQHWSGPSRARLQQRQGRTHRVWHHDRAYRIETTSAGMAGQPPGSVRLNNGDGSHTEFLYFPARKRATLNLNTVKWKFAQTHPEEWKKRYGQVRPQPPEGNLLQTLDDVVGRPEDRKLHPGFQMEMRPGWETVEGRRCRVYVARYAALLAPGKTDPNTRTTRTVAVWPEQGLALRTEILSESLGSGPNRPLVTRRITTVRELRLNPPHVPARYELPPGTVCEVFTDYAIRLPKGVTARPLPGSGLTFDPLPPSSRVR